MNLVYSAKLGEPTGSEPCTLQEAKDHLKVDYSTDDTLITTLISSVRHQLEQYTGVSYVARQVDIIAKLDGCHAFELPYGPAASLPTITELKVLAGVSEVLLIDQYTTYGGIGDFIQIIPTERAGTFAITYTVGYTTLPTALKQAVLHQIAYLYEHRGDEDIQGISPTATMLLKPFRRSVI